MAQKENRRVRITKLLLNESFLRLLALKPLCRITVKDICADADLNRSTYYQYYTDPYDQLNKLELSIIEEIVDCLNGEQATSGGVDDGIYRIAKNVLDYIQANKTMFQVLLSNHGDISLQKDILTALAEKTLPPELDAADGGSEQQKYIFVSTGSFGMIYYWLMSNSAESTDVLAKRIAKYVEDFLQSK